MRVKVSALFWLACEALRQLRGARIRRLSADEENSGRALSGFSMKK